MFKRLITTSKVDKLTDLSDAGSDQVDMTSQIKSTVKSKLNRKSHQLK